MTDTIEPTEEQKQAARQTKPCGICTGDYGRTCACTYCDDTGRILDVEATLRIASLLAEREHKLREDAYGKQLRMKQDRDAVIGSLSVRVAELESKNVALHARISELEKQRGTSEDKAWATAYDRDLRARGVKGNGGAD